MNFYKRLFHTSLGLRSGTIWDILQHMRIFFKGSFTHLLSYTDQGQSAAALGLSLRLCYTSLGSYTNQGHNPITPAFLQQTFHKSLGSYTDPKQNSITMDLLQRLFYISLGSYTDQGQIPMAVAPCALLRCTSLGSLLSSLEQLHRRTYLLLLPNLQLALVYGQKMSKGNFPYSLRHTFGVSSELRH